MDKYASPSAVKLLVGNKSELTDKRVVDFATGKVSSDAIYAFGKIFIMQLILFIFRKLLTSSKYHFLKQVQRVVPMLNKLLRQ